MKSVTLTLAAALVVAGAPAHAKAGDVLVRARAILVSPTESSGGIEPAFHNDRVSVTDSFAPEVDVTYFVSDNIGLELIAATTKHDIKGKRGLEPVGKLADTWVLPPTLTLQYHFAPAAKIRPYVGAGVNYTIFYSEDASNSLEDAIGNTQVELNDSFGYALQAGVDIDIGPRTFLNFDVKYIDIDTRAKLTTGSLVNRVNVSIDPIVVGARRPDVGLGDGRRPRRHRLDVRGAVHAAADAARVADRIAVVARIADQRPAVIAAAGDAIELVAALRAVLVQPQLAADRMDRRALRIAVPEAPDLGPGAGDRRIV